MTPPPRGGAASAAFPFAPREACAALLSGTAAAPRTTRRRAGAVPRAGGFASEQLIPAALLRGHDLLHLGDLVGDGLRGRLVHTQLGQRSGHVLLEAFRSE